VDETNLYSFINMQWDIGDFLIEPSLRFDYFQFNYLDELDPLYNPESKDKFIFSPKINTIYNVNNTVQLFLKGGIGFHSNDSRTILEDDNIPVLPAAYGVDLGTILKPTKRMIANIALWYLYLEQEFVYVGDEGVVEPSGRTRRLGVDVGLRYQFNDWIFGRADANYAFARSIDEEDGENLIPLAPIITSTIGLDFKKEKFNASIQFRYLGDRPANEDNSIVAKGYAITDLSANYNFKHVTLGFAVENLFNQQWNETQFATESRLFNELESVEEIHFTPGTPFQIRGVIKYVF
jgi:outer membrane receptor protein involved in Fe transport